MATGGHCDYWPDKRRSLLIKNAYLGLEKVENCHKVSNGQQERCSVPCDGEATEDYVMLVFNECSRLKQRR